MDFKGGYKMIESQADLRSLFRGTTLADCRVADVAVLDSKERAFVIEVDSDGIEAWKQARALLEHTGRWPVLTIFYVRSGNSNAWKDQVVGANLFNRFSFKEEPRDHREDDSPGAIIDAARSLNVSARLAGFDKDDSLTMERFLEMELERTQGRFQTKPIIPDVPSFFAEHAIGTPLDLERWLFQWELSRCPDPLSLREDDLSHLHWFEPIHEKQALVLIPSPNGWEAPAYMHWFAAQGQRNSQLIVALLREWHEQFGAELVAHFGTMLQFSVARRPQTAEEAFQLAVQQYLIAPCTMALPDVSVRNHARALLQADRWFLHERP